MREISVWSFCTMAFQGCRECQPTALEGHRTTVIVLTVLSRASDDT
jgi:hypothetical protein